MIPAHFICWNHFYSFLSVQTRVQETKRSGPPESRRTLSRRNHFSSFLPGETEPQGARRSGSPGCTGLFFEGASFPHSFRLGPQPWKPRDRARRDAPHFFSREPLSLIPSGWDRSPGSQEIGLAGMHRTFFQGNHFSSSLPAGTASPGSQEIGLAGIHCTFFQGNHFSSFPLFHGRRWPHQTFSSSSSSSSSPQRDSGILAVRKTGESVLRLLPPTS